MVYLLLNTDVKSHNKSDQNRFWSLCIIFPLKLCLTFWGQFKSKGLTILLASHFMDEVEALCDEICIIRQGKSVFQGTVEQAKEASRCEKFEDAYLVLSGEEGEE